MSHMALSLLRILVLIFAIFLIWLVILYFNQKKMIYPGAYFKQNLPGSSKIPHGVERLLLNISDITHKSAKTEPNEKVEAWFLKAPGVSQSHPGPAVLFAHGNYETIDEWPERLRPYLERGISILIPEYRGYGKSGGKPSKQAILDDCAQFYDLIAARPEVDPTRIFFHGRSLGGGIVSALSKIRKPAAIILESTYTRIADMTRAYLAPGFLVTENFDNVEMMKNYPGQVLLIHGTHDERIPSSHSVELSKLSPRATLKLYSCGHNDCPPDLSIYWRDIDQFLGPILEPKP